MHSYYSQPSRSHANFARSTSGLPISLFSSSGYDISAQPNLYGCEVIITRMSIMSYYYLLPSRSPRQLRALNLRFVSSLGSSGYDISARPTLYGCEVIITRMSIMSYYNSLPCRWSPRQLRALNPRCVCTPFFNPFSDSLAHHSITYKYVRHSVLRVGL